MRTPPRMLVAHSKSCCFCPFSTCGFHNFPPCDKLTRWWFSTLKRFTRGNFFGGIFWGKLFKGIFGVTVHVFKTHPKAGSVKVNPHLNVNPGIEPLIVLFLSRGFQFRWKLTVVPMNVTGILGDFANSKGFWVSSF